MTKLLTRLQAANYIGVDPKTFDRAFRADPAFPRFQLSEHTERFTVEAIDKYIADHTRPLA